jgi:ATP-binding cassette subfamily B protein/ATP-binding cassette subfamily C protein/ATP-binding cassette subfamily B multidrug efflux pump
MFGHREMTATEVGVLYAFISYLARVIEPLIQITMQFSQLQQSVVASARVATLLDEGAPRTWPTTPVRQRRQQQRNRSGDGCCAVAIRHLNFAYNEASPCCTICR